MPAWLDFIKPKLATKWAFLAYGLLAGVLLILTIRFVTYSAPHHTHYHANFGVYINGVQEKFSDKTYYQEVNLCGLHDMVTPQQRTHMHNSEAGVVHVHDDGVTWGQFFENLGWYVGPDFIRTPDGLFVSNDTNKLNIVLNGENLTGISTITNELIDNRDRLLVSYGNPGREELGKQYGSVLNNAAEYNNKPDPAACSGPETVTFSDRIRNLL